MREELTGNIHETKGNIEYLNIYKNLPSDLPLTKEMLDTFLRPEVVKYYELNLRAKRQKSGYFTLSDGDLRTIIGQSYLNVLKQIERGQKPIWAKKIKELFGQITYNTMMNEMKVRWKWKTEYIDNLTIELADGDGGSPDEIATMQEWNHNLYLEVMKIAQDNLTKIELDCFTFKYYSNWTHKQIKETLNISNINKVSLIINSAEKKLREATKKLQPYDL